MSIEALLKPNIRTLKPIVWGNSNYSSSSIVLKWGEYPLKIPKPVQKAIRQGVNSLNNYPSQMLELKNSLSNYAKVPPNYITLVNGSDKAFRLIAECFIESGDEAITFYPSYPVFNSVIEFNRGKLIEIPLTKRYLLPSLGKIKNSISSKTKLIYICNPNNPTGNIVVNRTKIEKLLKLKVAVIIDEAYFEYSNITYAPLIKKYDNLIIFRSFSKTFGLAGLRVGYILTNPMLSKYLQNVEETIEIFNISTLSLLGALAALKNIKLYKKQVEKIRTIKKTLSAELINLGINVCPSETSFLLIDTKEIDIKADEFIKLLENEGIILKNVSIYKGLDSYKLYLGIPKPEDLNPLIRKLNKILKNK